MLAKGDITKLFKDNIMCLPIAIVGMWALLYGECKKYKQLGVGLCGRELGYVCFYWTLIICKEYDLGFHFFGCSFQFNYFPLINICSIDIWIPIIFNNYVMYFYLLFFLLLSRHSYMTSITSLYFSFS